MNESDDVSPLHDALLLQELGSSLRHALRNHLAAVRNAGFFLERRFRSGAPEFLDSDPRLARMLSLIESEVKAAEALLLPEPRIESLLGHARGKCDASAVARAVTDDLSRRHGVSLVSNLEDGLRVHASASLLAIALGSIVENAIEAASSRGDAVEVSMSRPETGWVAITVTDDGGGAEGDGAAAIKPFQTTKDGRLGVGLARARRAAIVWEGRLELTPREPRGTCATLFVPVAVDEAREELA